MNREQSQRRRRKKVKKVMLTQQDKYEHAVYLCIVSRNETSADRREMRHRFVRTFS